MSTAVLFVCIQASVGSIMVNLLLCMDLDQFGCNFMLGGGSFKFFMCFIYKRIEVGGQASMQNMKIDLLLPSMPVIEGTVPYSHSTLHILLLLCPVLQGA